MRDRRRTLLPTVLALTFVTLLVTAIAASAASGLPPTITMDPESAPPGDTVVVTGLDFPPDGSVQVQLATPAGLRYLDTITATADGYFTGSVTLPADVDPGAWELQASAADGISASFPFSAAVPAAVVAADQTSVRRGTNSLADIAVMLVLAVLIAGAVGAVGFVYYQINVAGKQPGMSEGDDPIWSGGSGEDETAETSSAEPAWLTTQQEPLAAPSEGNGG